MTRYRFAALICALLCLMAGACVAEEWTPAHEALVHEALLGTMPAKYYPDCEFFAEKHAVLGTQEKPDGALEVYLSASVGGYGFMGGGFVNLCGWGGPCTVVLHRIDGEWAIREVLEIEDYNQIPDIMPKEMERRFYAQGSDAAAEAALRAEIQAYLDGIGRTEPILPYTDVCGETSGMLTQASNLMMCVGKDYPLTVTTQEKLEKDGRRYVYAREWTPDADGPHDVIYSVEGLPLLTRGTTGTETLTKTRKADGRVVERIVIRAERYQLILSMWDEGGDAQMVFHFDENQGEYLMPTIERYGDCGMEDSRRAWGLPEDPLAVGGEVLAQAALDDTHFVLERRDGKNRLVCMAVQDGRWQRVWESDALVPDTPYGSANMIPDKKEEEAIAEYPRFCVHYGDTLALYAGDADAEHERYSLLLERGADGAWRVAMYSDDTVHAYLQDDRLLLNAADFSAMQLAGLWFEPIERRADRFDIRALRGAQSAMRKASAHAVDVEYFADAEPLHIAPGKKVSVPVHVAPDAFSPRAANGKAAVSLNDWVALLGREGDWLMVLYEVKRGTYRTGWVDASGDALLASAADMTMPARFMRRRGLYTDGTTALFDDPVHQRGKLLDLPDNTEVTLLWEGFTNGKTGSPDVAYVEVNADGTIWRGFVDGKKLRNR